jgi:hypothetical protein
MGDARTWDLTLQRGGTALLAYRLTTQPEKECSFPITLHLVGAGGGACRDWPATVTIRPA